MYRHKLLKRTQNALSARCATVIFLTVFLPVLALYIFTLAPGVVGGDAGEHQLAVPLLGIPHTTGYPLYILAGKLWTLLIPVGTPAWRVNLFSALGGALAAGLTGLIVYQLSGRLFPGRRLWAGAIVAGVALSFGAMLWQWSVIAGVRSFNIFFFALLTLEAAIWAKYRQAGEAQKADRLLGWIALTVGLSLAHHRTTVFYLPSLVAWVWWYDRTLIRRPKRVLLLMLFALAPLLLYTFTYVRGVNNPPYSHEKITDLESFWFLVGSGDSTGLFFSIDPAYLPARLTFIWNDLLNQLSLPGVALALLGAIVLVWRSRPHFLFQSLLVLLLLIFTLDFEVVNLNEAPTFYLMPAYFIFAVWLGLGIDSLTQLLSKVLPNRAIVHNSQFIQSFITIIFLALLTYTLGRPNWQAQRDIATAPLDDWRQLLRGTQAQRFVESSLPYVAPDSIIWGDWEQYTPIKYYQLINGLRPDVTARNPLDRWPEKVAAAREINQAIYFTRKPADLIGTPYLTMVGPLIQLQTEPTFKPPPDIIPLDLNFEDELELIGYRSNVAPQNKVKGVKANPILQLTLYWRMPHNTTWDYALSLRLIDSTGQERYRTDATHPVLSSYPTSLWSQGEVVADYYELPLPLDAGPLRLHVLPYRTEAPGVWHNLVQTNIEPPQEGVVLGPFFD